MILNDDVRVLGHLKVGKVLNKIGDFLTIEADGTVNRRTVSDILDDLGIAHLADITQAQITSWDAAASLAHSHPNIANLNTINQNLGTGNIPNFLGVTVDSIMFSSFSGSNKKLLEANGTNFNVGNGTVSQINFQLSNTDNLKVNNTYKIWHSGNLTQQFLDDIATAIGNSHTHNNLTLLQTYTQTEENLASAVSLRHSHPNKSVIDSITAQDIIDWDGAVTALNDYVKKVGDTMTGQLRIGTQLTGKRSLLHLGESQATGVNGFDFLTDNTSGKLTLHPMTSSTRSSLPAITVVRANNFVGINTENPTTALEVNGATTVRGIFYLGSGVEDPLYYIQNSSGLFNYQAVQGHTFRTGNNATILSLPNTGDIQAYRHLTVQNNNLRTVSGNVQVGIVGTAGAWNRGYEINSLDFATVHGGLSISGTGSNPNLFTIGFDAWNNTNRIYQFKSTGNWAIGGGGANLGGKLDVFGQINTQAHGNSSQWKEAYDSITRGFIYKGHAWDFANDYNLLLAEGRYSANSDTIQVTMLNRPSDYSGVLEVTYYSSGAWCFQRYTEYGGNQSVFTRRMYNGAWSAWVVQRNSNDVTDTDLDTWKNKTLSIKGSFSTATNANNNVRGTGLWTLLLGNGSGNTNWPDNSMYGNYQRISGDIYNTDVVFGNNGAMYHRTFSKSVTQGNAWRMLWDNDNLPNPASQAWATANFMPITHVANSITATNITNWNLAYTNNHTHGNKTILDGTQESFTTALKNKLDNLQNYVLPTATSLIKGGVMLFSDTVQTVAATAVSATASRTYGVQFDVNGRLVTNVPWVNTTYTAGTLAILDAGTSAVNQVWSALTFNQWLASKNYITAASLIGYATESWVLSQGYVTANTITRLRGNTSGTYQSGDLTLLSTTAVTVTQTGTDYSFDLSAQTKSDIANGLVSFGWGNHALAGYLTSTDLNGYATETWVKSFGIGKPITEYNNISTIERGIPGGLYSTNTGTTGGPLSGSSGSLLSIGSGVSGGTNSFIWITGNNANSPRAFFTHATNTGVMQPWEEIASQSWVNSQNFSTQTLGNSTSNLIVSNTVQRAALTGDVTASQNSNATTIATNAVTFTKLQNIATARMLGRVTTGSGNVEELTQAQALSFLGVQAGSNNYTHPNHTGDVTSLGDGATTIVNNAVTFLKMQNINTQRLLGRGTAGSGNIEEITLGANLSLSALGVLSAVNTVYTGSNGVNVTGTVISPTYGTSAGTIAQGNDSRINNGQTAFNWGPHAGLYPLLSGSYANPTWISSLDWSKITNKPTIPTANDFITTNTTQAGLSGNKTTSGIWTFSSSFTTSLILERTGSDTNNSMSFRNGSGNTVYLGQANSSVFAIGGTNVLNTIANRWMWVDNTGLVSSQNGFSKAGAANSDVLLGSGGHRPVSDFALVNGSNLTNIQTWRDSLGIGTLINLTTTNKNSLVEAVNEINANKAAANSLQMWSFFVQVNVNVRRPLQNIDGTNFTSLADGSLYEVFLSTSGTGTTTGSKYVLRRSSGNWSIRTIREYGVGSNHPRLELDADGIPVVYTAHATMYNVFVNIKKYVNASSSNINDITYLGLDFQSLQQTPTTLAGYGITDAYNNYLDTITTTNGTTGGTVYTFKRVGLSDLTLTLTDASASFSGVVTTGAQTFEGVKEFLKSPKVPAAANDTEVVNKLQMETSSMSSKYIAGTDTTYYNVDLNNLSSGVYAIGLSGSSTNVPAGIGTARGLIRFGGAHPNLINDLVIGSAGMAFRNSNNNTWRIVAQTTSIPTGQLTVNTTSDLVGGYVYLPSGNVTTTLGLATHVLNAIVDGQTAYSWGNFRDFGLGTTALTVVSNIDDPNIPNGFYSVGSSNTGFGSSGTLLVERSGAVGYVTQKLQLIASGNIVRFLIRHYRPNVSAWSPWVEFWHSGNFTQSDINNWNTSFGWGNFRDYGLGLNTTGIWGQQTSFSNIDSTYTTRQYGVIGSFFGITDTHRPQGWLIKGVINSRWSWMGVTDQGPIRIYATNSTAVDNYVELFHTGNFNPANYATVNEINNIYDQLSAKANTRLSNVVSDLSNAEKTTIKLKLGISEIESPYKAENDNIKTIGNGWQTYVGGRFNQALGDKITIKGNNLNYIGFNHVGSGALHAVLGNYNVNNGVLNNIVGNYSSANSNLINLFGNYLYTKQEGQSVYGNYNKLEDAEIEPEKKKIHVFASGKSEYERDNAVEIFADNSTKLRGRGYYDAETRQEEWFSQENTLADIKFLKTSGIVDDIPNTANGTLTQLAASGIFVGARNTVGISSTQFFALATNSAFNCFATHGILRGSTVRYKGQIGPTEFTPAEHNYLANILEVPKNQYLIAEYKTDLGFVTLRLLDGVGLMSIKKSTSAIGVLIGYFISVGGGQFAFEFKQQIL